MGDRSYAFCRLDPTWREVRESEGQGFIAELVEPGESWLDCFVCPDDRPMMEEAIRRAIESARNLIVEHRVRRVDGSMAWVRSKAVPFFDTGGEIGEWLVVSWDISERKRSEQALIDSRNGLETERNAALQLHELSTQLIRGGELEDLYEKVLDAALEIMGADCASIQEMVPDRDELRLLTWRGFHPRSSRYWDRVSPSSSSPCGAALRVGGRVVISNTESCEALEGTEDLVEFRRSGIRSVQSTPLVSRDGRVLGMISTHWKTPHDPAAGDFLVFDILVRQVADLIERKNAEDELRAAHRGAERANRAMKGLLATVSHELKTPLTAIVGYSDALLREGAEPVQPGTRQRIERIAEAAEDLEELIKEVTTYSQLEAGQVRADVRETSLEALLDHVRVIMEPLFGAHDLQFDIDTSEAPSSLRTDPGRLRQILLNLLGNAAKFTMEGRVELRVAQEGDDVLFSVSDTGCGIDAASRESLFEPFWRGPGPDGGHLDGTGLGLTISRHYARLLGGDVSVKSAPNSGSTFTLRISLRPASSSV